MRWTAINRRASLGLLAGGLAGSLLSEPTRAGTGRRLYLSARGSAAGGFHVSGFTPAGRPVFDLPLPARGHAFAVRPGGRIAVHFARRPGVFAVVIDLVQGRAVGDITTPDDRHFHGHGVFSPDGRLLYATENDFAAGRGVIGVYDAGHGYRRIGELPTHGIGPHELRLLGDGETLAVANGGILTHPDLPRVKLNLPDMTPSLVYLDRRDGRPLATFRLAPDLHQLSIRHLAVGRDNTVAVAMQYEGPAGDRVPLIAKQRGAAPLRLVTAPPDVLRAMNQYCGGVAFDRGGAVIAVSAPRGNIVTFWEANSGRHLSTVPLPDGCGVAPAARPGMFLASSGRGGMILVDAGSGSAQPIRTGFLAAGRWDNHMAAAASG